MLDNPYLNVNEEIAIGVPIKLRRWLPNAILPKKQHKSDSCWDLYAAVSCIIPPHGWDAIETGFDMQLPRCLEATIRSRSGIALHDGVFVMNSPGTIDSGYRGPVRVILANFSNEPFVVSVGDRIAQMTFQLTMAVTFEEVDKLDESDRGKGGFGSTGT